MSGPRRPAQAVRGTGISKWGDAAGRLIVLGNAEHRFRRLPVLGQPADNLGWGFGRDEHLTTGGRYPLPDVRTKRIRAARGLPPSAPMLRVGWGLPRAPRRWKPETEEDSTSLMGRKVRAIQTSDGGNHLLWWVSPAPDHDVMLVERLRERPLHRFRDRAALEFEAMPGDHARSPRTRSGFSDSSLLH